jgi:hypothetical protein
MLKFQLIMHGVEQFDEAKPLTPDMGSNMGGLCPYECPLKSLVLALAMAFLPSA